MGSALRFLLLLFCAFSFSSCTQPEEITESTVEALDEIGKERKIGEDIQITPSEEEKVKVQF